MTDSLALAQRTPQVPGRRRAALRRVWAEQHADPPRSGARGFNERGKPGGVGIHVERRDAAAKLREEVERLKAMLSKGK